MSEAEKTETTETETAATPDVFDGDSVSSDPEWQAAMGGDEAGEGEAAKTGEEAATEQSGSDSESDKTETGEEAKEAETKTDEKEAAKTEERKPSPQVPIQALHEERDKRQGLERELAELKGRFEEFSKPPAAPQLDREAEVQKLMESGELTQVEAELRFDLDQQRLESAENKKFRENQSKSQKDAEELQAVHAEYSAATVKFKETQPDFDNAYNFALNARAAQLRFEHPDATQAQINNAVVMGELSLAAASIKRGEDPAKIVYEYAKTFGYQDPKGEDNGAAGEKTEAAEETDAEKKLLNIQKGEEASRSASSGSTGDTGEGLTFDSLKNKKGKEFDQGWDQLVPSNNDIFNT